MAVASPCAQPYPTPPTVLSVPSSLFTAGYHGILPAGALGLEKKAEELVSLKVEDGEGVKNWRRDGLFAQFQLKLDYSSRVATTGSPCVLMSSEVPATINALPGCLRAWMDLCAMALLPPVTWWVFLVICLSSSLWPGLHSSGCHSHTEPSSHFCKVAISHTLLISGVS